MNVIRFNELTTMSGVLLFDLEDDKNHLKEAAFYLDKKTEDMSDEQLLAFIHRRMTDGMFTADDGIELNRDIFGTKFAYLQHLAKALPNAIVTVFDYAIQANLEELNKIKTKKKGYKSWL
jgi:hypothetical protein